MTILSKIEFIEARKLLEKIPYDDTTPPHGRAVTTGHEIIGHGRSIATGISSDYQHEQATRTENLILIVMGIPFINTGINHGNKTPVYNPSLLPSFR